MPIHWFPGHMATAKREIRAIMPEVDLVIEVLDARIPYSSENPLVEGLRGKKPRIQVLNKRDLADPAITEAWLAAIRTRPGVTAIAHQHGEGGFPAMLIERAKEMVGTVRGRPMAALILGIPNVGKSTLINTLARRTIAKTGNKPAVTQMQQRINAGKDLALFDTPGFLWPKLSPAACGYRLAVTGAIADRVLDYQDIAAFAARFLLSRYPERLVALYGAKWIPDDPAFLVENVGRSRGVLGKGGVVDLQRAAERLIHDLRDGRLGPLSLETPEDCGVGRRAAAAVEDSPEGAEDAPDAAEEALEGSAESAEPAAE